MPQASLSQRATKRLDDEASRRLRVCRRRGRRGGGCLLGVGRSVKEFGGGHSFRHDDGERARELRGERRWEVAPRGVLPAAERPLPADASVSGRLETASARPTKAPARRRRRVSTDSDGSHRQAPRRASSTRSDGDQGYVPALLLPNAHAFMRSRDVKGPDACFLASLLTARTSSQLRVSEAGARVPRGGAASFSHLL